MTIRPANLADSAQIKIIYHSAFPAEEASSVNALAQELLENRGCHSWVAECPDTGDLKGHISFSPVSLSEHPGFSGQLLAPLAVYGGKQKTGIGSALTNHAIDFFKTQGSCQSIFVYGDPKYYGRFGFEVAAAEKLLPKHPLKFPFGWQAIHLSSPPSQHGTLQTHAALDQPALW